MSNSATIFVEPETTRRRPIIRSNEKERHRLSLVRVEPDVAPAPPLIPAHAPAPATVSDDRIVAILDRATDPSETFLAGFARKEAELRDLFAALPVSAARELHRRLSVSHPSDTLAQKFKRLTAERRTRLSTFLADARRRAALASAKR